MTELTSNNDNINDVIDFASAQAILTSESVNFHASEIHGVLTGLVCAGFEFEDRGYFSLLSDLFNSGDSFSGNVKKMLEPLYNQLWTNILDDNYSFNLLLPDDDDTIAERGHALSMWVQEN